MVTKEFTTFPGFPLRKEENPPIEVDYGNCAWDLSTVFVTEPGVQPMIAFIFAEPK